MTMHKSYGKANKSGSTRNVLTRWERIKILEETGREEAAKKIRGLPKTKSLDV